MSDVQLYVASQRIQERLEAFTDFSSIKNAVFNGEQEIKSIIRGRMG